MNFLNRLKFVFSKTAFEEYRESWYSGDDLPNFGGSISEDTALKYSAFFGCQRVLAETFASVGIHEYKKLKDGDREKTNDTGLFDILHGQPNDETSPYNFQECSAYQKNIGGNFVAQRLFDGQKLVGLSQMQWQDLHIYRDKEDRKIKYKILNSSNDLILNRNEVLHVPGPSLNGIVGMSLLEFAAGAILLGNTYERCSQKFYKNGMMPSGTFEMDGHVKPENVNEMVKHLKKEYAGLTNAGTPMLLEDGLTYKQLTIKPIDAELLSSKKFQVEDICRFHRMPPHMIQNLERSTDNNIEHQSLEFIMYTMLPHFKVSENCINAQLLTPKQRFDGYYMEYNLSSLLRGDQESMAKSFAVGRQWGWLSVNDIRRLLNMNGVPGGDTYLQPLNMVPVGTVPTEDSKVNAKIVDSIKRLIDESSNKGNL